MPGFISYFDIFVVVATAHHAVLYLSTFIYCLILVYNVIYFLVNATLCNFSGQYAEIYVWKKSQSSSRTPVSIKDEIFLIYDVHQNVLEFETYFNDYVTVYSCYFM